MEKIKSQFETVHQYLESIQKKLGEGVFLSGEDFSGMLGMMDDLRREQARVCQLVGDDLPEDDAELSIQAVEKILAKRQDENKHLERLHQLVSDFTGIRSLSQTYQAELEQHQKSLAAFDDAKLLEMDEAGELEPYHKFIECVRMDEPVHDDVLPLSGVFSFQLLFGILGKQLILAGPAQETSTEDDALDEPAEEEAAMQNSQESTSETETPTSEAEHEDNADGLSASDGSNEENPTSEKTSPETAPQAEISVSASADTSQPIDTEAMEILPPITDSESLGKLVIRQSGKRPKGTKTLLSLFKDNRKFNYNDQKFSYMLYIIKDILELSFIVPDPYLDSHRIEDQDAFYKVLSVMSNEGYLIEYSLDGQPEMRMYGASRAGYQIFRKDSVKKYYNDLTVADDFMRVESAAEFLRRYWGRCGFYQTSVGRIGVSSFLNENALFEIIPITVHGDRNISVIYLPAVIMTENESDKDPSTLCQRILELIENRTSDLKIFVAGRTDEEGAAWVRYLKQNLPTDVTVLQGLFGKDTYSDPAGKEYSLQGYLAKSNVAQISERFHLEQGAVQIDADAMLDLLFSSKTGKVPDGNAAESASGKKISEHNGQKDASISDNVENEMEVHTDLEDERSETDWKTEPAVSGNVSETILQEEQTEPNSQEITDDQEKAEGFPLDIELIRSEMGWLFKGKKYPSALTMSRILAKESEPLRKEYQRFAYALDDPAFHGKRYTCSEIQEVFGREQGESIVCDALGLAAYLRMFFSSDAKQEIYNIYNLMDVLDGNLAIRQIPELKSVLYDLVLCAKRTNTVFTPGTLLGLSDGKKTASARKQYQEDAGRFLLSHPEETQKRHPRISAVYKNMFGPQSEFRTVAEWVRDGDEGHRNEIKEILGSFLLSDAPSEGPYTDKDIDWKKIERVADETWSAAGEQLSRRKDEGFKDPSRSIAVSRVAELTCIAMSWVGLGENGKNHGLSEEKQRFLSGIRKESIGKMKNAAEQCMKARHQVSEPDEQTAFVILADTLDTLSGYLSDGCFDKDRKYFYIEFLKDNRIELDGNWIPYLEDDFSEIAPLNLCKRVLKHSQEPEQDWQAVIRRNFEEAVEGCDFGHADQIRVYLQSKGEKCVWPERYSFAESIKSATRRMEDEARNFQARLDLAENYGWIEDTRELDRILADMEKRREHYLETQNFGFYFRTTQAYWEVLQREAEKRKGGYQEELDKLRAEKGLWPIFDTVKGLIDNQMYMVAQDYMDQARTFNRQDAPVSTHLARSGGIFEKYLNQYDILQRSAREADEHKIVEVYLRRTHERNIERTGRAMLERWPRSMSSNMADNLKLFFRYLGLPVDRVAQMSKKNGDKQSNHFKVMFSVPEVDINYPHPIGAYGTEMFAKGLHVFVTFGKRTDSTMNTELQQIMSMPVDGPAIVLADTAITLADRRSLAQTLKGRSLTLSPYLILDRVLLFWLAEFSHLERWDVFLQCALPFHYYNPYTESHTEEICPEMFIGRREELNSIVDQGGANIVYGGRQLGKTALLQRARKLKHIPNKGQWAFYIDIKGRTAESTALLIYNELRIHNFLSPKENGNLDRLSWDELTNKIIQRMKNTVKPVYSFLLLLDEADVFLQSCGENDCNYAPIVCLKRIQSDTNCFKFVLAGLHKVMQFYKKAVVDDDSPIPHLATITMKPLPFHEARELVEMPLSYLGFRIQPEDEHLIGQILSSTNYFPGLIQYYCSNLVKAVNRDYRGDVNARPPYWLEESQILTLLKDREFQDNVKQKYMITLGVDAKDKGYYRTLAYALAHCHFAEPDKNADGYTAADICALCRELDIRSIMALSREQVDVLLNELIELNVLRSHKVDDETRYVFNRASFRHMLGDEAQVDDELTEIMEGESAAYDE